MPPPALASQLVDQVIAPPIPGHLVCGLKEPQPVPAARQSSALSTTLGLT
jgi:hypothetical protein